MEILILVLIGLAAGTVKGASGFGSSLLAIPLLYLAGYTPSQAVTLMITCNLVLNMLLIYDNRTYFHMDTVKKIYPIILAGSIFTGITLLFRDSLNPYYVELTAAGLILIAIINKISKFDLKLKDNFISLFGVGVLSGIGNGLASMDGPPVVFYLLGINAPQKRFKSTLAIHFLIMGIIGVIVLSLTEGYNIDIFINGITLFFSLIVGSIFGMFISKRLNEETFQRFIIILLVGLMISLIIP